MSVWCRLLLWRLGLAHPNEPDISFCLVQIVTHHHRHFCYALSHCANEWKCELKNESAVIWCASLVFNAIDSASFGHTCLNFPFFLFGWVQHSFPLPCAQYTATIEHICPKIPQYLIFVPVNVCLVINLISIAIIHCNGEEEGEGSDVKNNKNTQKKQRIEGTVICADCDLWRINEGNLYMWKLFNSY